MADPAQVNGATPRTLAAKKLAAAAGLGTLGTLVWFFFKAGALIFGSGLATAAAAGAIAGGVIVLSRQTIHDWVGAAIAVTALALLLKRRSRNRSSSAWPPPRASPCTGPGNPSTPGGTE